MPNDAHLPTALQQAGIPDNQTGNPPMAESFIQAPLPTAFDNTRRPFMQRVAITGLRFRPATGSMYLAQGHAERRFTTDFWMAACNSYRQRSLIVNITSLPGGPSVRSDFEDEITLAPSVTMSGPLWTPPDRFFQQPDDFIAWTGDGPYDQVFDDPQLQVQDVTGGTWVRSDGVVSVTQSISAGEAPRVYVDNIREFLLALPLSQLWGASPPTLYQSYFCNTFPAELGNFAGGFVPSIGIADINFDITNLAARMAAEGAYAYDAAYYPINRPGLEVLPGAVGFGADIGDLQGFGTFGIIGDWVRCRVGAHALCASVSSLIGINVAGREAILIDRVQIRSYVIMHATVIEQAYAYFGLGAVVMIRKLGEFNLIAGQIFEIPQSTFRDPYVSNSGPGPCVIHSSDIIVIFNSSIEAYYAHLGSPPTVFLVDTF